MFEKINVLLNGNVVQRLCSSLPESSKMKSAPFQDLKIRK